MLRRIQIYFSTRLVFGEQGPVEQVGDLGQVQDLVSDGHPDPRGRILRGGEHPVG